MSDFKAKMYQIQFQLGLCPRSRWGSLQRSPRLTPGPTSKGSGGNGKGRGKGRERMERGEETTGGDGTRPHPFMPPPVIHISGYASGKHYIGPVGWLTVFLSASFEKKLPAPLVG